MENSFLSEFKKRNYFNQCTNSDELEQLMNKNKIPIILETPIDDRRDEFGDIGTAKELA